MKTHRALAAAALIAVAVPAAAQAAGNGTPACKAALRIAMDNGIDRADPAIHAAKTTMTAAYMSIPPLLKAIEANDEEAAVSAAQDALAKSNAAAEAANTFYEEAGRHADLWISVGSACGSDTSARVQELFRQQAVAAEQNTKMNKAVNELNKLLGRY